MSKVQLDSDKVLDMLNFLAPGFERSGSHMESQLLHIESRVLEKDEGDVHFLVFSTRSRFVISRFAIKVDVSAISTDGDGRAEPFNALIDFDRMRGLVTAIGSSGTFTMQHEGDDYVVVRAGKGRYRFSNEDTVFDTSQPKTNRVGVIDYETLHALFTQARLYTDNANGNLEGASVNISYNAESGCVVAAVYNKQLGALFSHKVPEDIQEHMQEFNVNLKGAILKKFVRRKGRTALLTPEDQDAFAIRIPEGQIVIQALNDVEDHSDMIRSIIDADRPHHFEIDTTSLEQVIAKMSLFAAESLTVEVKDSKAVFSAISARGVDAREEVSCVHDGDLFLELPIKVVSNIVKVEDNSDVIRFDVDEEGQTANVSGTSKGLSYNVVFSVVSEEEDQQAPEAAEEESIAAA